MEPEENPSRSGPLQVEGVSVSGTGTRVFATKLQVRPDDLDFFKHVHASRYQDYVLAARFDQMERCYGASMQRFMELGLGWYVKSFQIRYRRSLGLGDLFEVLTWVEELKSRSAVIGFEIRLLPERLLCSEGSSEYTLINLENGRPTNLPSWVREAYAI
jgi:YbgC/YbaW family acyl-CoA thioester hydrolase